MRIIRNSLPLLFLAAVFSFNACQRYDSLSAANTHDGALPAVIAIMQKSKSPNLRRAAALQIAEIRNAERKTSFAFAE